MTLSKYQDRSTYWHDKETEFGKPRSNNGYIYTAYAKYLAPGTTDRDKILARYLRCIKSLSPVMITRLPGKEEPPLSKDEVVGMVSLGLLTNSELDASHYNFSSQDVQFERKLSLKSIYRAIKALYKIKDEHRNYVWENKVAEAYPLAFMLPPQDQYYVKEYYNQSASLFQTIMFYINFVTVYFGDNKSSRMMLWLQLEDLEHPLRKLIPKKKWVTAYFGLNHDFTKGLTNEKK